MGCRYVDEDEAIDQYRDVLNESYPEVVICGYRYAPAYALEELDPTAFRCGMIDWLDSEDLTTDKDEAMASAQKEYEEDGDSDTSFDDWLEEEHPELL